MLSHENVMARCFQLARKAELKTKTNPNVGAVLVYNNRVIGEGYHRSFGGHHAEKEAILSVLPEDRHLVKDATLYISLEPCCVDGKTPACTGLIIRERIRKVVISCIDPDSRMQGKSISLLRDAGVDVITGILEHEGKVILMPFMAHLRNRPFILLKFAQSSDAYIGKRGKQVWLSNHYSLILTHQLRTLFDGILIGTETAITDNPQLTSRYFQGRNPLRIVLDRNLRIPRTHHLWADQHQTVFVTTHMPGQVPDHKTVYTHNFGDTLIPDLMHYLYHRGVHSLMVEGGSKTIAGFLDQNQWDQAHINTTPKILKSGIRAPQIRGTLLKETVIQGDIHERVLNPNL